MEKNLQHIRALYMNAKLSNLSRVKKCEFMHARQKMVLLCMRHGDMINETTTNGFIEWNLYPLHIVEKMANTLLPLLEDSQVALNVTYGLCIQQQTYDYIPFLYSKKTQWYSMKLNVSLHEWLPALCTLMYYFKITCQQQLKENRL